MFLVKVADFVKRRYNLVGRGRSAKRLECELVFAGSYLEAMRRISDKVFSSVTPGKVVDLGTEQEER